MMILFGCLEMIDVCLLLSYNRSDLQIGLVRGCWSELFSLGMAQCSQLMSLPDILSAIITALKASVAQDKVSAQRVKLVSLQILNQNKRTAYQF